MQAIFRPRINRPPSPILALKSPCNFSRPNPFVDEFFCHHRAIKHPPPQIHPLLHNLRLDRRMKGNFIQGLRGYITPSNLFRKLGTQFSPNSLPPQPPRPCLKFHSMPKFMLQNSQEFRACCRRAKTISLRKTRQVTGRYHMHKITIRQGKIVVGPLSNSRSAQRFQIHNKSHLRHVLVDQALKG